ncbi:protein EMSY-LIKE 3 [Selaginella moellendorffii]|uniref:protein EMSY-LIKE 3 n=1 Tax=Selaginella moellendorffii TaxID=88036 RepID=UPI000D1C2A26|nr:protein EMSY-LIKE 3 [Selaginella moellendorffii]|eukprot:XP_024529932.1 protein EMSY-LIKE 3 [Selaginella moellendorffii]
MSGRRSHSMEYDDPLDSSGTDDDLPPTHSAGGRASRGVRVSGNGRAATGVIYASSQPSGSVDHMIHRLEQEAYTAVLRAFGAQSEVITWAKERLMTDLRKELRVTDEQHREFLGKVASDESIKQIQQLSAVPPAIAPSAEVSPPPVTTQSRKKQKTALLPQAALPPSSSTPTPPLPPHIKTGPVQSTSGSKRPGPSNGPRGKKQKLQGRASSSSKGHGGKAGRPPSNKASENSAEVSIDPYIGKKVKTRWPEDNAFYEALITDYNAETGRHALVYDMDTANETWEWIDLKEVPPSDLKWVEGPNAVIGRKAPPPGAARGGMGRGMKRGPKGSVASPGGKARGGTPKMRGWKGPSSAENGSRSSLGLIPIEDLAKEVDKLEEDDDLAKLEDAKKAAKAHEENIRRALAQVGESSDEAESDDAGQPPSSQTQSVDHEREHRSSAQNSREHTNADSDEEETAGNERAEADGSDGEHTAGEGGAASDAYDDQQGEDGDEKDEDG